MCLLAAGRDGKPASCLLLYRFADIMRLAAVGNQEYEWEVRRVTCRYTGSSSQNKCDP